MTPTPPYEIEIWHDQDVEDPSDYALFRVVTFNSRWSNYEDPNQVFACRECGEDRESWQHPGQSTYPSNEDGERWRRWDEESRAEDPDAVHEYLTDPAIAFVLNYYEHGLCRWYVAPMDSGVDVRWDMAYGAGVLMVNDDNEKYWDTLAPDERLKAAEQFVDMYTDYCNGNTWGYTISVPQADCDKCGHKLTSFEEGSCGGYIGDDDVLEAAKSEIAFMLGLLSETGYADHTQVKEDEHYTLKWEYR